VFVGRYLILALVLVAGMGQPVQVAANAKLRQAVQSPVLGALLSFMMGAALLTVLVFSGVLGGRGKPLGATHAPWWAWLGGVSGVLSVVVAILALPHNNAATVIAMTILGQLTASIVMDHFGWLDVPQVRMNARRSSGPSCCWPVRF
jgi:bacterial/archaeal transporter family-2 protein